MSDDRSASRAALHELLALLREVETLTARVIAVDHFDPAEVKPHYMKAGHNAAAAQRSAAAE